MTIHQTIPAEALLEIINDPRRAEALASTGWDVEEMRVECDKAKKETNTANNENH